MRTALAAIAVSVGLVVASFVVLANRPADAAATAGAAPYPGEVVAAVLARASEPGGRPGKAADLAYRSTDRSGALTVVTGTVHLPATPPPPGGYPVLSFGHGTTGIDNGCAPDGTARRVERFAATFLAQGIAVVASNYQGLDAPGPHPYLDSLVAGRNMIDIVRASRAIFPELSTHWIAVGTSQGGGAAWSAAEQQPSYAPELTMLGAAALSPSTSKVGLVDHALAGTLSPYQRGVYVYLLESLRRTVRGFTLAEYRRGGAVANWPTITGCGPDRFDRVLRTADADVAPGNAAAARRLRGLLQTRAIPTRRTPVPIFVGYGTRDGYLDAAWLAAAVDLACGYGDTIVAQRQEGQGHAVDQTAMRAWIGDRLAGLPAPTTCVRPLR